MRDVSRFFIAFSGKPNGKLRKKTRISKQISVWNLSKFTQKELTNELQKKIPLLSHLDKKKNYKLDFLPNTIPLSWGILIEDKYWEDVCVDKSVFVSMCNLFSDIFLTPLFTVDDLGIRSWDLLKGHKQHNYFQQDKYKLFATNRFAQFYDFVKTEKEYFVWYADYIEDWIREGNKESWRIHLAYSLYKDLETYDYGKKPYTYLKEVVDMSTVLEILLTSKGEKFIEDKLKKRSSLILKEYFPKIETDIEDMYKKRCEFIHGEHFQEIAKNAKLDGDGNYIFPTIDFDELKKYRNYLRYILISYLVLNKSIRLGEIVAPYSVSFIKMSEKDEVKRKAMKKILKPILNLL